MSTGTLERVRALHTRRERVRAAVALVLVALVAALFAATLMVGDTFYGPGEVARVVLGQTVPGASFTVGELRLPRATLSLLAGAALGLGGAVFQTVLRNTLAAPDVVGVSAGAGTAALLALVVLHLGEAAVSFAAVLGALATTVVVYALSYERGASPARLVLVGIALAAMLQALTSQILVQAAAWDLAVAMRWLAGSVNGATWEAIVPLAVAWVVLGPLILALGRRLQLLELGDDTALALGVRVERLRLLALAAAAALVAFATAAAGPIAFVALVSAPIAARVAPGRQWPGAIAALVGATLVLGADLLGQQALSHRYPVGVMTALIGAPYLVLLLVRANRGGGNP